MFLFRSSPMSKSVQRFVAAGHDTFKGGGSYGIPGSWVLNDASGGGLATLDIDFVNDRAYNQGFVSVPSLLTCSRASSGYYTNADGTLTNFSASNSLRYGTNGLLVEEARTNLQIRSQELGTDWGTVSATVSSDTTAAPDGTTTADTLTAAAATNVHLAFTGTSFSVTSATVYTFSVYAKKGTNNYFQISTGSTGFPGTNFVNFDLNGGTVGTADSFTGSITALANGWYRCAGTITANGTGNERMTMAIVNSSSAARQVSFAAAGTETVILWGMQVEAGSFPTSYIPTTTASATRAADVVTDNSNLGTWFNATTGTLYAQTVFDTTLTQDVVGVNDTSFNNAISFYHTAAGGITVNSWVRTGGVTQANFAMGVTPGVTSPAKYAFAYAVNDFAGTSNNGTVGTDGSGSLPTPTRLQFGKQGAGISAAANNILIKRFAYWNSRLSNGAMGTLTT